MFCSGGSTYSWTFVANRFGRRLLPHPAGLRPAGYLWWLLRQGFQQEEARPVPRNLPGKALRCEWEPGFADVEICVQQLYCLCKQEMPMDVEFMLSDTLEVSLDARERTRI
jgi:hypothetical protein